METLLKRQSEILEEIKRLNRNFKKDSSSRKTPEYIAQKLTIIDQFWEEFQKNHDTLESVEDKNHQYFIEDIYEFVRKLYISVRTMITTFKTEKTVQFDTNFDTVELPAIQRGIMQQESEKLSEWRSLQNSNFRALRRLLSNLNIDSMTEKWELEDEIKSLQSRWNGIDSVHLQLDGILQGSDLDYETEYSESEKAYRNAKKSLNKKLASASQQQHSTPQMEIPTFTGKYTQWPTFMDLYTEAIHTNPALTKTQKMQHLKGKLRGEAEKLVQHLHIAADNYDTCWEILTHRYDNKQLLFTNHMQLFLRQPKVQKQSAFELKKLYDTTTESIFAIHNLGVDTKTWDPMLVHILCEKLDTDTYAAYMESRKDPRDIPTLDEFMQFIEAKFTALEPVSKRKDDTPHQNLEKSPSNPKYQPRPYFGKEKSSRNRAYHIGKPARTCPFCNRDHALFQCEQFLSMPPDTQLKTMTELNICQNCLFVHDRHFCKSEKRCQECDMAHNTKLHDTFVNLGRMKSKPLPGGTTSTPRYQQKRANYVASADEEIILPTALVHVESADGTYATLRALIDQGSQITIITENAAQRLGLARQQYDARITGVGTLSNKCRGKVHLTCKSKHDNFRFTTDALIMSQVVGNLPNASFNKHNWQYLQHVTLADPEYHISRPIDMLLDADIYAQILMSGLLRGAGHQPIAQQTKLGWILSGNSGKVKTYNCNVVLNEINQLTKYWEIEEIASEQNNNMTPQEQFCEDFYSKTTQRLADGRYQVRYPMKFEYQQQLGESKPQAVAQFLQLERKLTRDNTLSESYKKFVNEYLSLEHMKKCNKSNQGGIYLPHHGVIKEDSVTTKLRVVFNASAKTSTGVSLNDVMECGPKLHKDLQGLLIQWRLHKYVFTADCEKMYRMILVHTEDQKLQKIVWRNSPHRPLEEYKLCTLTYGTKAAPFLALRTLQQLAQDEATYQLGAKVLRNDIYVDDVLSGADSLEQAIETQHELIEMLRKAGLNLRKWASNDIALLQHLTQDQLNPTVKKFDNSEATKTLGLQWIPMTDTFKFTNKNDTKSDTKAKAICSKRTLLSDISKIFDPLGWLSPTTIKAKLLFQSIWVTGTDWDEALPEKTQKEWDQIKTDIANIEIIEIPRWVGDTSKKFGLHGFCDASEKAYACAIYVTTIDNDNHPISRLLVAKTKLAPLKKATTLPRLELCGALLLARLFKKVLTAFDSKEHDMSIHAWTDSMIVLGWIHGDSSRWKTFVANRVQEITDNVPACRWNHVTSEENAVDCATRGTLSTQLYKNELWWNGPKWLTTIGESTEQQNQYEPPQLESKEKRACTTVQPSAIILELLHKNSNLEHIVRVVAWILRFYHRVKKNITHGNPHLTSTEIENAYKAIIRDIQKHEYSEEVEILQTEGTLSSKSNILSLNPYLGEDNILRVGGRLNNAPLTSSKKHPIILPNNSRLTELLITQTHERTLHGGPRLTLSHIREKFWIVSGYRAVKKQLHRCVRCRRFNSQQQNQIMADLPKPRVTPSRPFTHTGVDFTGHVEIKANKGRGIRTLKGYIAVFVCLATKAIHLELVSDLSTTSFLAAFHRFCSRRGKPRDMYSDNGTNFVGANRILKQQYQEIMKCIDESFLGKLADIGIQWHFNAPAWPSAGGLWEAAVKSMKHHLKRVIGDQKMTYEEFATLLCRIEACLNSRPLYQLTENVDDIDCLTPGHFLIGDTMLSLAEPENTFYDMRTRWQMVQKMTRDFWKRWSSEYLQQLQARQKWRKTKRDFQVNDIVCIKEENLPPARWALGRIIELHPGKDGHVRVVTLKTKNSVTKRPITKLAPLLTEEQREPEQQDSENSTNQQKRRKTTIPSWRSFLITGLLLFITLFTPGQFQPTTSYNVTAFTSDQSLYFDKVTQLQQIRDEWKLIVYYNMTSYWINTQDLQNYVTHISQLPHDNWLMQFQAMVKGLEHEMAELQYYNSLLKQKKASENSSRTKRGLINGVGYLANELFGVLDERFAEKYESDIKNIGENESHLAQLLRNQTSVIEAEQNILQRNENIMNKQFSLINEHLQNMTKSERDRELYTQNALYVMTNTIVANSILTQMKRTQETLIDMITDLYHGHLNIHILSPKQLQSQLDTITKYLPDDMTLPDRNNLQSMYKLLKMQARVTMKYIIIEIRIPLLSSDQYELNKIVSIPQLAKDKMTTVIPAVDYIAYNMKKDTLIPLDSSQLQTCRPQNDHKIICTINNPVYDIKLAKNICDIRLITTNKHDTFCRPETRTCTNKWIELHQWNTWLFACCEECFVRILCPADFTSKHLRGVGTITLGQGCVLKSDTITIYGHNNYSDSISIQQDLDIPNISPLNEMINTSTAQIAFEPESHGPEFVKMQYEIKNLKEHSQLEKITFHDIHHYVGIYTVAAVVIIVAGVFTCYLVRAKGVMSGSTVRQMPPIVTEIPITSVESVLNMNKSKSTSLMNVKFDTKIDE